MQDRSQRPSKKRERKKGQNIGQKVQRTLHPTSSSVSSSRYSSRLGRSSNVAQHMEASRLLGKLGGVEDKKTLFRSGTYVVGGMSHKHLSTSSSRSSIPLSAPVTDPLNGTAPVPTHPAMSSEAPVAFLLYHQYANDSWEIVCCGAAPFHGRDDVFQRESNGESPTGVAKALCGETWGVDLTPSALQDALQSMGLVEAVPTSVIEACLSHLQKVHPGTYAQLTSAQERIHGIQPLTQPLTQPSTGPFSTTSSSTARSSSSSTTTTTTITDVATANCALGLDTNVDTDSDDDLFFSGGGGLLMMPSSDDGPSDDPFEFREDSPVPNVGVPDELIRAEGREARFKSFRRGATWQNDRFLQVNGERESEHPFAIDSLLPPVEFCKGVAAVAALVEQRVTFGELRLLESFVSSGFPTRSLYQGMVATHNAFTLTSGPSFPSYLRVDRLWGPFLDLSGRATGGEPTPQTQILPPRKSSLRKTDPQVFNVHPLTTPTAGPKGAVASLSHNEKTLQRLVACHVAAAAKKNTTESLSLAMSFSSLADGVWILQAVESLPLPSTAVTSSTPELGTTMILPLTLYSDSTPLSSVMEGFSAHPMLARCTLDTGANNYVLLGYMGHLSSFSTLSNHSQVMRRERRMHSQDQTAYVLQEINELARVGMQIEYSGVMVTVYPRVAVTLADNPELHLLAGVVDGKVRGKAPCVGDLSTGPTLCLDPETLVAKRKQFSRVSDSYLENLFQRAREEDRALEGVSRGVSMSQREVQLLAVLSDLTLFPPRMEGDMVGLDSDSQVDYGLTPEVPPVLGDAKFMAFVEFYRSHSCTDTLHTLDLGVGKYLAGFTFAMVKAMAYYAHHRVSRIEANKQQRLASSRLGNNFRTVGAHTDNERLLCQLEGRITSLSPLKGSEYRVVMEYAQYALDDQALYDICTPPGGDAKALTNECHKGLKLIHRAVEVYAQFRASVAATEHTLKEVYEMQAHACCLLVHLHALNMYRKEWSDFAPEYGPMEKMGEVVNIPQNVLTIKSHMLLHYAPQIIVMGTLRGLSTETGERALVRYAKSPWRKVSNLTSGRGVSMASRVAKSTAINASTRGEQMTAQVEKEALRRAVSDDGSADVLEMWLQSMTKGAGLESLIGTVAPQRALEQLMQDFTDCHNSSRSSASCGIGDDGDVLALDACLDASVGEAPAGPSSGASGPSSSSTGSPSTQEAHPSAAQPSPPSTSISTAGGVLPLAARHLSDSPAQLAKWTKIASTLFGWDRCVGLFLGVSSPFLSSAPGRQSAGVDHDTYAHSVSWALTLHTQPTTLGVCHSLEHIGRLSALLADRSFFWNQHVYDLSNCAQWHRRFEAVESAAKEEPSSTSYRWTRAELLALHATTLPAVSDLDRKGHGGSQAVGIEGLSTPLFFSRSHLFPKLCKALKLRLEEESDLHLWAGLGTRVHRSVRVPCGLPSEDGTPVLEKFVCDPLVWNTRDDMLPDTLANRVGVTGRRDAVVWSKSEGGRLSFGRLFAILSLRLPRDALSSCNEDHLAQEESNGVEVVVLVLERYSTFGDLGTGKSDLGVVTETMGVRDRRHFEDIRRKHQRKVLDHYAMVPLYRDRSKPRSTILVFGHPDVAPPCNLRRAIVLPDGTRTGEPGRRFVSEVVSLQEGYKRDKKLRIQSQAVNVVKGPKRGPLHLPRLVFLLGRPENDILTSE